MLNFKNLRIERNLNQKEFADKIGISTRALSNYENGNLDITLKKMQEIASILEIHFFELLTLTQKNTNNYIVSEPVTSYEKEAILIIKKQEIIISALQESVNDLRSNNQVLQNVLQTKVIG